MAPFFHPWRDQPHRKRPEQLTLDSVRYHSGRGGPRHGAGRPRGIRPRVMHRYRERIVARVPVHVTIRLRSGIPTLRQPRFVRRFRSSLSEACIRHGFRVVHYSIQRDHVHLLIEAHTNHSIACGMKSVGARIGKLANRLFQRKGKVLDGRYHLRPLRTPLEVYRALRYVLLNHRHHAAQRRRPAHPIDRARVQPDPASSGRWFDGWRIATAPPNPTGHPAKSPPPEPGSCKPPGAATGSSIPQRFPKPNTQAPRPSSSNERNATNLVLPTSYSTPRSTTHATTPRRGRRRTPGR